VAPSVLEVVAACFGKAPLLVLVLLSAGCGRGVGDVSGKVSYRGKALADGTVMLLASDGRPYDAPIQADGTFHIAKVPSGDAKVSVSSVKPGSGAKAGGGSRRAAYKPDAISRVPLHYSDFSQSNLTVTVVRGTTTPLDLDLK
jgi:hypothetical protein